jgi:predicted Zn finger-like uncharacterized protein
MTIDATCPNCGTLYTLRSELLGKRTKCTRCGTHFTITETPHVPTPPPAAPTAPPAPPQPVYTDIPTHLPHITRTTPTASPEPAATTHRGAGEFFGFEQDKSQPHFPALRIIARAYEIMAVIVLIIAAVMLVIFFVQVIAAPKAILVAIMSTGFAAFWLVATSLMFLFVAQAIRLGLQIEQNTRETQHACRQLAEHFSAIQHEP